MIRVYAYLSIIYFIISINSGFKPTVLTGRAYATVLCPSVVCRRL